MMCIISLLYCACYILYSDPIYINTTSAFLHDFMTWAALTGHSTDLKSITTTIYKL